MSNNNYSSDDDRTVETQDLGPPKRKRPSVDWKPGEVVSGRYQILRRIGSGGMGVVALADDLFLRKKVAVKALRPDVAANPVHLERFRKEVALAHTVTHPNIARTYDLGEANSIHYFSMEYLEGIPLNRKLWEFGPMSVSKVKEMVLPICSALEAAHQAKVIHRDLKPSNLMLVEDARRVVIMDFGISGVLGAHQSGEIPSKDMPELVEWDVTSVGMGTPQYMSPEQWLGEPCGPQSDIYSLGCIMFQCLTGRPPFRGEDKSYYFNAHVSEEPPRLRDIDPAVPKDMDAIVARCLQKDPADRFRSAGELAEVIAGKRAIVSWLRLALWGIILAAVLAGLGWGFVRFAEEAIKVEMKPSVTRLAQLAAQQFPLELIERVRIGAPYQSDAYWAIQDSLVGVFEEEEPADTPLERDAYEVFRRLRNVVDTNPGVKWAYVFRKLDDSLIEEEGVWWEFVGDGDPIPEDMDGNGILEGEEQGAMPGHHYDSDGIPGMLTCLQTGQPTHDEDFIYDEYGYTLSGYAPIGDVRGPGGYILGIDASHARLASFRQVVVILCICAWVALIVLTRLFEFRAVRKRSKMLSIPRS